MELVFVVATVGWSCLSLLAIGLCIAAARGDADLELSSDATDRLGEMVAAAPSGSPTVGVG
jgi:hypothetical protein